MRTYIALLKGINVGGNRRLPMADLKAALTDAGFADVRTILASGNVVLDAPETDPASLESRLASATTSRLGVTTDYMVRDANQWRAMIGANPFPDAAEREPKHLLVVVMKTEVTDPKALAYLETYEGPERVAIVGREIFIYYPDGQGTSRLSIPRLGNGTARNLNTVARLAALLGG